MDEQEGLRLQCLWKLRDFKCGVDLINRIHEVVEVTGHFPDLHLEQPNQVRAELWTASIGEWALPKTNRLFVDCFSLFMYQPLYLSHLGEENVI